ncbi:hypothetical protein COB80_00420 [Candidatus Kaiserbacteria bacterium]|nr:MAG: hypothetical protein COB80_00420 [Candidatus Kaiserbacteria bacterium]
MKETPSNNIDSLSYIQRREAKKIITRHLEEKGLPTSFRLRRFTKRSKDGRPVSWKASINTPNGGPQDIEGTYE